MERCGCDRRRSVPVLLLLSLLLFLLLPGCAGDSGEAETPPEPAEQSAEVNDDRTPISFWYAASGAGISAMEGILSDFNAAQSEYRAVPTVYGSYTDITHAVQDALATGNAPDLAVLESDVALDLFQKGQIADLTRLLRADGLDPARFLPVYFDLSRTPDGQVFSVPFYGTTQVLYYNKAAFSSAGIEPGSIKTWQDLANAARRIRDAGICSYGWEPMWGYENLLDAAFSNGARVFSPDGKTVTINSPEWIEVWEAFRGWLHSERIMRIHSGGVGWEYWYHTMDDALTGAAGGFTGSSGDQADVDFNLVGMLAQPAWTDGQQASPEAKALLLSVLASESGHFDGACALLHYLVDVPAQVKWSTQTGYIAANRNVNDDPDYRAYLARNPYATVPTEQSLHASVYPPDPTGGAVREALRLAADRVEIEGISARDALDEAQRSAQRALDAALAQRPAGEEKP